MKVTIRKGRMIKGYVNTYRGPQLDMVTSWVVETPNGAVVDFYPKKAAEHAATLARQGLDITKMDRKDIGSAWHLFKHGTEQNPGRAGAAWSAFLASKTKI